MKIDISKWKEFRVKDIFLCSTTKPYIFEEIAIGQYPYVTRTAENNGCATKIDGPREYVNKGNCITIGAEGTYAFYQPDDFIAGVKVYTLRNENLNSKNALLIVTVLNSEVYKYNYGRARILEKIKEEPIKLPATASGDPDWDFMEEYMGGLHSKPLTTSNKPSNTPLNTSEWGEFRIDEVFTVKGGYYNKKPEHSTEGAIPFLAATENNNGVTECYSIDDIKSWNKVGMPDCTTNNKLFDAPAIAVTVDGSVCNAYYQATKFTCSHSVSSLQPRDGHILSPREGLFCCTVIRNEKYRWSYGRKPHDVAKLSAMKIKLPITPSGDPDWNFMENYIKSIPYGDKI